MGHTTPESSTLVEIPSDEALSRLRLATCFSADDLEAVTGEPVEALSPLICEVTVEPAAEPAYISTRVCARPLLQQDELFVLVEPATLPSAIRNALISALIDAGMLSYAVEWLARAALAGVERSAERMDWNVQWRVNAPDAPIASLVGGFDVDKAFAISVLYDDLNDYSRDVPDQAWDPVRWTAALERTQVELERRLLQRPGVVPNEILHVVILAGCGRPSMFGLGASPSNVGAPRLLLTTEALTQISLSTSDSLTLWKYVQASERLRQDTNVLALGPLDEFAAWSTNQLYYLDDDSRPNFLLFDASSARDFRLRHARLRDIHSVISPQRSWLEVIRIHDSEHIPIFGVLDDLGGQPMLLVEGAPRPIWIQGPKTYTDPEHRRRHAEMIDCLAYWLWQVSQNCNVCTTAKLSVW